MNPELPGIAYLDPRDDTLHYVPQQLVLSLPIFCIFLTAAAYIFSKDVL